MSCGLCQNECVLCMCSFVTVHNGFEGVGACRAAGLLGIEGLMELQGFRVFSLSHTHFFKHTHTLQCYVVFVQEDRGRKGVQWRYTDAEVKTSDSQRLHSETMVKCLIRIKTKVNVHLRMINHCYRDVKVRVLTMGPRLLGKVLGALPLFPSLPSSSTSSGASSRLGVQHTSTTGKALAGHLEQLGEQLISV